MTTRINACVSGKLAVKFLVGILSLSAPAVVRADVVVDWTVIAGNTAGG